MLDFVMEEKEAPEESKEAQYWKEVLRKKRNPKQRFEKSHCDSKGNLVQPDYELGNWLSLPTMRLMISPGEKDLVIEKSQELIKIAREAFKKPFEDQEMGSVEDAIRSSADSNLENVEKGLRREHLTKEQAQSQRDLWESILSALEE